MGGSGKFNIFPRQHNVPGPHSCTSWCSKLLFSLARVLLQCLSVRHDFRLEPNECVPTRETSSLQHQGRLYVCLYTNSMFLSSHIEAALSHPSGLSGPVLTMMALLTMLGARSILPFLSALSAGNCRNPARTEAATLYGKSELKWPREGMR